MISRPLSSSVSARDSASVVLPDASTPSIAMRMGWFCWTLRILVVRVSFGLDLDIVAWNKIKLIKSLGDSYEVLY